MFMVAYVDGAFGISDSSWTQRWFLQLVAQPGKPRLLRRVRPSPSVRPPASVPPRPSLRLRPSASVPPLSSTYAGTHFSRPG